MPRPATVRASLIATVIIGALLPTAALADRLRCASQDYRYAACRANGRITNARLIKRHSSRPCHLNRTWGWRGDTLWVDQGCDAEFDIDTIGSGPGPYPPGPGPGPGPRPPYPGGPGQNVPNWAEGRWRATNGNFRLDIFANGRVRAVFNRESSGYWSGDTLMLENGQRLRVERERGRDRIRVYWPNGSSMTFRR